MRVAETAGVCTTADHEAIKSDPARWQQLQPIGLTDPVRGRRAELRNCTCGSTLAILSPSASVAVRVSEAA